jgi:hypothetical protein
MVTKKRILLLYHFMLPDNNVSAQHFSQLGQSLADLGYSINAWPSNRTRAGGHRLAKVESIAHVEYDRVSRFDLNQSKSVGRLLNSLVVITVWIFRLLFKRKKYDLIILGSDPIFSYVAIPLIKLINPNIRILYWAFDLHPEGTIAEGTKIPDFFLQTIKIVAKYCYARADQIIPLSECMREKLERNYGDLNVENVIPPWAIEEDFVAKKKDIEYERQHLFGNSKVAILYSGNFGKCHDLDPFLKLAECALTDDRFSFCIAGNAIFDAQILEKIRVKSLTNITLAKMVPYNRLSARLKAADFHFVSVKSGFSGVVVPSKMFGALAMDKPVIVSADEHCSLGQMVEFHECGFFLNHNNISVSVKFTLERILQYLGECSETVTCRKVYEEHYSREKAVKIFDRMLR